MAAASAEELKISDLAQESSHKAKKSWLPAIPLTILAPILVGLALTGVLVPSILILTTASDDTADFISAKYFSSLISDVKYRCASPIQALLPTIKAAVRFSDVKDVFTAPNFTQIHTSPFMSSVAILREQAGNIDLLVCSGARWRPGYGAQNTTVMNHTTVSLAIIQSIADPFTRRDVGAVYDDSTPGYLRAYALDPDSRKVVNTSQTTFYPYLDYTPTVRMTLGNIPATKEPYFVVSRVTASGLTSGYLAIARFDNGSAIPFFGCSAGINVDNSWVTMLHNTKPMENSVVALFDANNDNFAILSSSDLITTVNSVDAAGNPKYGNAIVDSKTASLRLEIQKNYPSLALATAAVAKNQLTTVELDGGRYIVAMGLANLAFNYKVLIVVALPRDEIYGKIDAARSRSRAAAVGISVGVTFVIAGIFALAMLPLFSLARQMEALTKLDFGKLESSGALDKRSWVWELRKVQIVFGTMVKAFAGAIKKNKQMVSKQGPSSSVSNQKPKASEAASDVLRTTEEV
ncbi:hypothetical protein DFJ77DRAFT_456502 [Powellomyces hirtus]|nr:hypothetical protein DFJ77DRAFT_456502 [Powellomyces hirtus]